MADPLADVIAAAVDEYWDEHNNIAEPDLVTAAVRAHLAAVLDAEEAKHQSICGNVQPDAAKVIRNLRAALGVAAS